MQKNILITTTYCYPYLSGLAIYPYRIAQHLAKKHKVIILTYKHNVNIKSKKKQNNLLIIRLSSHLGFLKGMVNFIYPYYALKQVQQAEVIIVNLPQLEGIFPALWARLFNKKLYVIYHCDLQLEKSILFKLAAWTVNLSSYLTCLLSQKIITNSQDYAQHSMVLKHFLYKTTYTFPPIKKSKVDPNYLKSLKEKYSNNSPILGYVGRISQEKGVEYLLQALDHLQKDFPNYVFLIAGPSKTMGENKYRSYILKEVERNQFNVQFLSKVNRQQLTAFYQCIDLLIIPSINKTESFGMTQIEAMLQGTPVLASNMPGVRVAINSTKMGLLAKPKDSQDLANKIIVVLKSPKKYQVPKKQIGQLFNPNQTYQVFDQLIENG